MEWGNLLTKVAMGSGKRDGMSGIRGHLGGGPQPLRALCISPKGISPAHHLAREEEGTGFGSVRRGGKGAGSARPGSWGP